MPWPFCSLKEVIVPRELKPLRRPRWPGVSRTLRVRPAGVLVPCLFIIVFLSNSEPQDSADSPGDHPFLVSRDNANGNLTALGRNRTLVSQVPFFVEFDSKKSQAIADASTDRGCILPDAFDSALQNPPLLS